ncbi:unnamed protein product [Prunus armeniaca]|uniref:RNase H type-1 domain-containing protein n=1 Tax=Prunus armeniaca TaxID=36596 RepID=A0A6J5V5L7_PRUAR|nr:unnamed protein product [Prunus armeniaca]
MLSWLLLLPRILEQRGPPPSTLSEETMPPLSSPILLGVARRVWLGVVIRNVEGRFCRGAAKSSSCASALVAEALAASHALSMADQRIVLESDSKVLLDGVNVKDSNRIWMKSGV